MTLGDIVYVTSPLWAFAVGWYGNALYKWWQGLDKQA